MDSINIAENISKKDKEQASHGLGIVALVLACVTIFAVPLVFLPMFSDPLDMPKQFIMFFVGVLGLLILAIKKLFEGRLSIVRTTFDLPMLLLGIVAVVSSVLTPNLYTSLSSETLILIGGACLFFLFAGSLEKESAVHKIALFFSISAGIIGLLLVAQGFFSLISRGAAPTSNGIFNFLANPGFNFAGSALAASLFLASILPLALGVLKTKEFKLNYVVIPFVILIILGLISAVFILFQNKPILLDPKSGWKIATEVIGESPKHALLGMGGGNIIDAFTMWKPAEFNNSPYWNLRFSTSSNMYLGVLTSFGIIGAALLVFFIVKFVKLAKARLPLESTTPIEKGLIGTIAVILVLGLIFPAPLLSFFLLFVATGTLMAHYKIKGISLYAKSDEVNGKKPFVFGAVLVLLVLFLGGSFFLGKFALADYYFAQSINAAAQNQGKETYELQIKALDLNPYNSNYRIAYSQTNLALANSLAGQENLTDEQKQTIVTLVQQAIREGRLAAALAPNRASAWENLSLIYRNLINFAEGADQWAVQTQSQAVNLDPNNPRLLLDLGGIFFAAQDYQNAAQLFNRAVGLKPDFANAHYNLAQSLKGLGQNELALQELQTTATLVCVSVNNKVDCDKVNGEIDELTKNINSGEATKSAQVAPQTDTPQEPLATPSGQTSLPRSAAPTPAPQVSTDSGELDL